MGYDGFAFANAAEVWDEFIGLTSGRPCDMAGMPADRLRRVRHLQWPCPSPDHPGSERLYTDGRFPTPNGRALFLPRPHKSPRETPDHEFPMVLTTGRLYAHWHTLTRTGKSSKLVKREPAAFVEIHPDDAAEYGLCPGQLAEIASRRGLVRLPVKLNAGLSRGLIFIPFHWGDEQGERTAANYLTIPAIGRVSKQPEYKFCAVRLAPAAGATEVMASGSPSMGKTRQGSRAEVVRVVPCRAVTRPSQPEL
jgi:ferredoxin-nitrate reductase